MKRKNASLSIQNHFEICELKKKKSSWTNVQLAMWAKEEYNLPKAPHSSTVSKILKRGEQGLTEQTDIKNRRRSRKGKWPQLEEAVILWVNVAENNKIPINWDLIKLKATLFAERIGIQDFQASHGWMQKFGKRHGIKMNRIHGEAGSADISAIEIDKASIKESIDRFALKDVYNFDETAFFYADPLFLAWAFQVGKKTRNALLLE
ncbi:hypothetical protein HMPREF1544_01330 [Mucor circinelloides 1006PhL]|uniref:HTH CENPB-type domain-containing protein n=1 Tax=Mucor circinelloides f. circinelloides (strain 1006PhL) TaxID=1220926 RepID=S2JTQ2_MUCC1|nr:hypothetical protein HMPREF1544_01330 [Mucor circinelloides 1006PhL]